MQWGVTQAVSSLMHVWCFTYGNEFRFLLLQVILCEDEWLWLVCEDKLQEGLSALWTFLYRTVLVVGSQIFLSHFLCLSIHCRYPSVVPSHNTIPHLRLGEDKVGGASSCWVTYTVHSTDRIKSCFIQGDIISLPMQN